MILKQAYSLIGADKRLATADGDELGLAAVNQIYSELWHREHRTRFQPLDVLQQPLLLTCRFLPAMAYGTAMLLCVGEESSTMHDRFLSLYRRAATHTGGLASGREDVL
jgi:hypothetical protein